MYLFQYPDNNEKRIFFFKAKEVGGKVLTLARKILQGKWWVSRNSKGELLIIHIYSNVIESLNFETSLKLRTKDERKVVLIFRS